MIKKFLSLLLMLISFSVNAEEVVLVCSGKLSGTSLSDNYSTVDIVKRTYIFKNKKYTDGNGDTVFTDSSISFNGSNKPCSGDCQKIFTIDRYSGVISESFSRDTAGRTLVYTFDGKCNQQVKRKF